MKRRIPLPDANEANKKVKLDPANDSEQKMTPEEMLTWFIANETKNKEKSNSSNTSQVRENKLQVDKDKKTKKIANEIERPKLVRNYPTKQPLDYLDENEGYLSSEFLNKNIPSEIAQLVDDIPIKVNTCNLIISHLFYGQCRTDIYVIKTIQMMNEIKSKFRTYCDIKIKTGQTIDPFDSFVYLLSCYMEKSYITESKHRGPIRRTPALPRNEEFVDFATKVIITQWKIVCLSPWGLNNKNILNGAFIYHALAVLNHMKKGGKGQKIDGDDSKFIDIIPKSDYATKYWPPMSDILSYKFSKSMITIGTNNLTYAYGSIKNNKLKIPTRLIGKVNQ